MTINVVRFGQLFYYPFLKSFPKRESLFEIVMQKYYFLDSNQFYSNSSILFCVYSCELGIY